MPYKNILRVIVIVLAILLIPLVLTIRDGGVEGVGWNWTAGDFLAMGTLLFVFGLMIDFAIRKLGFTTKGIAAVAGIVLVLLAVWTELAVGAVSQLVAFILG